MLQTLVGMKCMFRRNKYKVFRSWRSIANSRSSGGRQSLALIPEQMIEQQAIMETKLLQLGTSPI
tara:strand:+ start:308 stop:502 length:195 start_codon:yes stop_codon:yes gene_type:complete